MSSTEVLAFGGFELDRGAYQLRRRGEVVHLERVPLDLLFLLVARRGHLVTREEICERIWGKKIFIDVNASINGAVRKIRRALQDTADKSRFLEAVPAKGYRFIASVNEAGREPEEFPCGRNSLVGRESEMEELCSALGRAATGHGSLFLVHGQPGVGKTRLARELGAIARLQGMEVLEGQCCGHDDAVPYLPFVEILERCVDSASRPAQLRAILGDEAPELSRLLVKVRRLLPDLPPPLDLPAPQSRRLLFNCFCDFLARRVRERAAYLVLDDLHWADESSLALLLHLAGRLSDLPLLVVATYREPETDLRPALAASLEELLRRRLATAMRLSGLHPHELAELIKNLSGQSPSADLVQTFYQETEGNPFFVEELFHHLERENRLYDTSGVFRTELMIAETDAPPRLRLMLEPRLARLNDRTREIIGISAVIGRSFKVELLSAAADLDPYSDSLWDSVEEAEKAGLFLSCGDPSTASFEFSHELVRQAVLSGLSSARRLRLHLAVAAAIETLYSDTLEDHLGELAHHYRCSANSAKALEYLERAARQAEHRSAFKEALESYQRALAMLHLTPESLERNDRELPLRQAVVALLQMMSGLAAADTADAAGRLEALVAKIADSEESTVFSLIIKAMNAYNAAELRSAVNFAEEALDLSVQAGSLRNITAVHAVQILARHFLGDHAGVEKHFEQVQANQAVLSKPVLRLFPGAHVFVYGISAWTAWMLGRPEIALERIVRCMATVDRTKLFDVALAEMFSAQLYSHLRQWAESEHLARKSLAAAENNGFPQIAAYSRCLLGFAQTQLGLSFDGIQLIRQGIGGMLQIGSSLPIGTFMTYLAIAQQLAGKDPDALQTVEEALEPKKDIIVHRPEAFRIRGRLRFRLGLRDLAESDFSAAIAIARGMEAKTLELRATTNLASLLKERGRPREAHALLAKIYNEFAEGFDTADLKDAEALLEELST